jgi:pimeloyl-ACP methyl ester carboxylesterase
VTQLEVDDRFEDVHRSGLFVHEINLGAPGAKVILVHGAPDRSKNFARVLDELGLASPVTIYDRRGYGRSMDAGALGGGFTQHAEDLIDIIDQQPAIVIGQSAGGAIALQASIMAPDKFLALGVWEPPMVAHEWWGGAVLNGTALKPGWPTATWSAWVKISTVQSSAMNDGIH